MTVANIVSNVLNHKKIRNLSCNVISGDRLRICFYLPIPAFVDDSKLVTSENTSIIYRKCSKKGANRYEVRMHNVKEAYPLVSNNKIYAVAREYNIKDWLEPNFHIFTYLSNQRESIFREVKADILLQKIGMLSKNWDEVTSGKASYELTKPLKAYSDTVPRVVLVTNTGRWVDSNSDLPF